MERNESLTKTEKRPDFPVIVEAERMFERLAAITRDTAARAYELFLERSSDLGNHFEDWLRAEAETLRTAPAKITETGNTVNVSIAVPGFKPEEIEVSIDGDLLMVSGETKAEAEKDDEKNYYSEWRSNRFIRKLTLPGKVETSHVEAKLMDGVLKLTLIKRADEKVAKVAVKAA